ncbi:GGDEF domain-containing protein [Ornithinibacillus salinisoli]|uniref:GGDEF domain-containing protein n=1 Tax=Ornithinibacillus salinisoli TaxID=1848459 RepID=A0ABW4W5X1_9BACI
MKSNFRLKLFLVMIVFAIVISFTMAIINYVKEREQAIDQNQLQAQQIEDIVYDSIRMIDKAYSIIDQDTTQNMEENSRILLDKYEDNPNFNTWNFKKLKDDLGMDVYIINDKNVITHSSFKPDLGLDFSQCCNEFSQLLDERRVSEEIHIDGMDLQQKTGEIKKFSYVPTPDKKYLIELGYALEDGMIFQEFNFFHKINELVEQYPMLNEINILNTDGFIFGKSTEEEHLPANRKEIFNQTVKGKNSGEIESDWHGEQALYRYVFYSADKNRGISTNRVLEIIYNENELQSILSKNTKLFIIQLLIVLSVTIILALIITKWVARPMYLAFHDSLTGVKNRAAFDECIQVAINNQNWFALYMLDLDNFKLVNDKLGHDQGDYVLILIAQTIQSAVPHNGLTFRLGGDEFAVILPVEELQQVEEVAHNIIEKLKASLHQHEYLADLNVTASIGIAMAPENGMDAEMLTKKADIALYKAKEKGKNQYWCLSLANSLD